jgi:tetratricopeptide (TPR) repeat protein
LATTLTRRQVDRERKRLDQRMLAHLDAGEIREAIRMEPEYRELARLSGAPELLGYFLLDLGDWNYDKEKYQDAVKYYLAGLSELGGDPPEQGVASLQIAYCYSFQRRVEEALRWLDRCLENRDFYQNGRAAAFAERGRLEVERYQRYPESIYHYLCAVDLYDAKKPFYSPEGHQGALFGLALTFDEARLVTHARSYYQKVIKMGHPEFGYMKEAENSLQKLEKFSDPLP